MDKRSGNTFLELVFPAKALLLFGECQGDIGLAALQSDLALRSQADLQPIHIVCLTTELFLLFKGCLRIFQSPGLFQNISFAGQYTAQARQVTHLPTESFSLLHGFQRFGWLAQGQVRVALFEKGFAETRLVVLSRAYPFLLKEFCHGFGIASLLPQDHPGIAQPGLEARLVFCLTAIFFRISI
jgi:hypothetical protein